jgi:hypothetical protein
MGDILENDAVFGALEVKEGIRGEHVQDLTGMKGIKGIVKILGSFFSV